MGNVDKAFIINLIYLLVVLIPLILGALGLYNSSVAKSNELAKTLAKLDVSISNLQRSIDDMNKKYINHDEELKDLSLRVTKNETALEFLKQELKAKEIV